MVIEQNTNYAYKLKYMDNPTFDKVRDLAVKFYRELPHELQKELYETLNRGVDILDSEPQMTAYLFSFGKMHQAKLNYAYDKLPEKYLKQPEINIIDYGCGQALGTMCYADFLCKNDYEQKVKTITLIEPSEICLKRAALHASVFFPNAEIKTVNKKFDDLTQKDIVCEEETPTLHILSNVLDMPYFDLDKFSGLVKDCLKGYNQFVCVGPVFNDFIKDGRIKKFAAFFNKDSEYETLDKGELNPDKDWTCALSLFNKIINNKNIKTSTNRRQSCNNDACEKISTAVSSRDFREFYKGDEYGVSYNIYHVCDSTFGGDRLIICYNKNITTYVVRNGTHVICDGSFSYTPSLKKIVLPESLIAIGDFAFSGCKALKNIILPNSVKSIGNYAFDGCKTLKNIILPNSVKNIGNYAFADCASLEQITIPNSIIVIKKSAFEGCKSLSQITIPDSIVIIEDFAFGGCSSLKEIDIPNSLQEIGSGVFDGCKSLQSIAIPATVKDIGAGAFYGCKSLLQIKIPNSLKCIWECTFYNCSSLQQVEIPGSVEEIGDGAFYGCKSLKTIKIPIGTMEKFKKILEKKLWDKLVEE